MILKQSAVRIAQAFTRWNLWQGGGGGGSDEYKPGDVVNLGTAHFIGYANQISSFQGFYYLPKTESSEVSGVTITYTSLAWLRGGNGQNVTNLTYTSAAIAGNKLTINVTTTSTLTRFSNYLLAVTGCTVTFI